MLAPMLDVLVDLLRAVRRLSYGLAPQHRANLAEALHATEVSLKQSAIRVVRRRVEPTIFVTRPVSQMRA